MTRRASCRDKGGRGDRQTEQSPGENLAHLAKGFATKVLRPSMRNGVFPTNSGWKTGQPHVQNGGGAFLYVVQKNLLQSGSDQRQQTKTTSAPATARTEERTSASSCTRNGSIPPPPPRRGTRELAQDGNLTPGPFQKQRVRSPGRSGAEAPFCK